MINAYNINFEILLYGCSSLLSIFLLVTVHSITVYLAYLIYHHSKEGTLEKEEFKKKYGTIIEDLTLTGFIGRYWNIMVMARWTLVSLILVCLRLYPALQISLNLVISVIYTGFIIRG
jgi:hypothetical protein